MSNITDEMLMAYADGELSASERARVEAYLAANPAAQRRVEEFKRSRLALADLYSAPFKEPVPKKLVDTVLAASQATSPVDVPHRSAPLLALLGGLFPVAWMPAAAFACVLVVLAGAGFVWQQAQRVPALPVAEPALSAVLEHDPMAPGDREIRVLLTFARTGGGYCRQYVRRTAPTGAFAGVACRTSDGRWVVEAEEAVASAGLGAGYKVAAGASSPVVESAVNRLIRGGVLSVTDERKLIEAGWTSPRP